MKPTKMSRVWRWTFYALGMAALALGITINTKTGLGVSPIISIPYTISLAWDLPFAATTFAVYIIFVVLQFLLKGKRRQWIDLLQIPFSLVFSLLLDTFAKMLNVSFPSLWQNLLLLLASIALTALGVCLMVNMRLIPNPADGLAQALGDALHRGMGFAKNALDISSVAVSCLISLLSRGTLLGIGLGTVAAMIGVGRFIALFNLLFRKKMNAMAGLSGGMESAEKTRPEN